MRTPQLTEQYGQVDRVSVARAIFSSLSCATAGVRSNPRIEKPAPPTSAPLRKFLRENSIAHPPTASYHKPTGLHPKFEENYKPDPQESQCEESRRSRWKSFTTEAQRHREIPRLLFSISCFSLRLCASVVKSRCICLMPLE